MIGADGAHDPTIVASDDGLWHMFSTDAASRGAAPLAGVTVRSSRDLVTWSAPYSALGEVPEPARRHAGAAGLWAPEVVRWPGDEPRWHMYYSASTFGSRTSAIGLATAPDPRGPWNDRGVVIATQHDRDQMNAIDAAVTVDRHGDPWLAYGSFFDGIRIVRLDSESGMLLDPSDRGVRIARRPRDVDGAVEGAYILYRPREDRYVLFVSYDSLFSDYNIRVGVSDEITGPYRDARGRDLADLGGDPRRTGTKILGGYRLADEPGVLAPGHNSVLQLGNVDGEERLAMVHHARAAEDPTTHVGQVRRLYFTASGWPVVAPRVMVGEHEVRTTPQPIAGAWSVVRFDTDEQEMSPSLSGVVSADGVSDGAPDAVQLSVDGVAIDAVVFATEADGVARLAFSGIDADGVVWFGEKESADD